MTARLAVLGLVLLSSAVLTFAQGTAPAVPPVAPPRDIYLAPFKDGSGKNVRLGIIGISRIGFDVGKRINITSSPADDDQPSFLADSSGLLFSSNRDGQRDIYRYDIATKVVTQVTKTQDDELLPIVTPAGRTFSAVRGAQRSLWRFNQDGSEVGTEPLHSGPVGDYAWMSEERIAVFVRRPQGAPDVLHLVSPGGGASEPIDAVLGRSPRVPKGIARVTFMSATRLGDAFGMVDPATKKLSFLAYAVDDGVEYAWTPAGGLMMCANEKLFLYENGSDRWLERADLEKDKVTSISRIAVSPDGEWIAIVATPTVR